MSRLHVLIIIFVFCLLGFFTYGTTAGWNTLLSSVGMSSSTFSINFDSINSGGRDDSSSSSYEMKDTVGEVATGDSSSASYNLSAGYRQLDNSYISISVASDLVLPSLGGIAADESTGNVSWTVITDNPAGYELAVKTQSEPSLSSGNDFFEDYTPDGGTPDFAFSVDSTTSAFGFSPEGDDVVTAYRDNGAVCGVGSGDTNNACWDGFATTTKTISQDTSSNQPSGTQTTLSIRAANGVNHIQSAGEYSAIITVTATTR